ncbi:hypothetical protein BDV97DRAFT_359193 [Delphinella strobiligena]|nr:hypothetical protein BDV97DRAFT_359193 [Delphinella strobiligena]
MAGIPISSLIAASNALLSPTFNFLFALTTSTPTPLASNLLSAASSSSLSFLNLAFSSLVFHRHQLFMRRFVTPLMLFQ